MQKKKKPDNGEGPKRREEKDLLLEDVRGDKARPARPPLPLDTCLPIGLDALSTLQHPHHVERSFPSRGRPARPTSAPPGPSSTPSAQAGASSVRAAAATANEGDLQQVFQFLANDLNNRVQNRRISGITTANTITTVYKNGRPPSVRFHSRLQLNGHAYLDSQRTYVPKSHPSFGPCFGSTVGFSVCFLSSTMLVSTPDVFSLLTIQWHPQWSRFAHYGSRNDRGSRAQK